MIKLNDLKIVILSSVYLFFVFSIYSQQVPQEEPQQNPQAQENANNQQTTTEQENPEDKKNNQNKLQVVFLENFENSEDWSIKATSPIEKSQLVKLPQTGKLQDALEPKVVPVDGGDQIGKNHILGVKGYFYDKGVDRIEIYPPNEYAIKGIVKQISVWVLARNRNYNLYVKLRDYRGKIHKIKLGKLNFFGWRKLTANIPGYIPQSFKYSLLNQNLRFLSLFIVSDFHEPVGSFYVYFDNLQVKTDTGSFSYPGSQIRDNW